MGTLDFRDLVNLGESMPKKMPDVDKLQDLINPITRNKGAYDLVFKVQELSSDVGKAMTSHTHWAECVYLARTQGDVIEKRRQAKLDLAKLQAEEAEKKRIREEDDAAAAAARAEEDAIAAATRASLEDAAGVKSRKRKRRGE